MRTRLGLSLRNSPLTSATNSSVEISDRKPMMRNSPISVGSCASATNSIVLGPTNLSAIFFSLVLERLQILNQIQFLLLAQVRAKETVVVLDHVAECWETSVVIEAAFLVCPESFERSCSVTFVGRALGLKVVDSDLFRRVHVPARLGVDRWHVTDRAFRLTFEHCRSACRCCGVERSRRRCRRGYCELVKLKRRKFCSNQVRITAHVAETRARGDREFHRIVQTRIVERSLPVHLEVRDERVPMR